MTSAVVLAALLQAAAPLDTVFTVGEVAGAPEVTFGRIADVEFGGDGRLYVLDALGGFVRVFGQDGRSLGMFGGEGRGPGEIFRPRALEWVDSALAVTHGSTLSLFSADGELLDRRRLPGPSFQRAVPLGAGRTAVLRPGLAGTDRTGPGPDHGGERSAHGRLGTLR